VSVAAPSVVAADAAEAKRLADKVADAYRWLHASGYATDSAGDKVGGRSQRTAEDGSNNGSVPQVVASREVVRCKLAYAGRAVDRARGGLAGALVALHEVAALVDDGAEHLASDHDTRIPRTESKAGIRRAEQAKVRRLARGEGWGNA